MNTLLQPVRTRLSAPFPGSAAAGIPAAAVRFFQRQNPDQLAVFVVALAAAVLAWWNILDAPAYQDDEGTYTAQALATLHGNLAPYTYWYDHPPLGWLQLAALSWIPGVLGLGGEVAVGQMRYVVALYFIASTVLVFLIARRLNVRLPFAVLAALLYCLSPLSLVLGRQVFIDNIGLSWLLLAFYLLLSPQLKLWDHVGAGVCFAVAVLSKETLAIFGPALLVALLHRPRWETRSFSLIGFLSMGGLVLGFFPLLATLRGELVSGPGHVSLQDAVAFQFVSRPGSGSILDAGSGRQELVLGWMYYDNLLMFLGAAAAVVCLARREARWIPVALLFFSAPILIGHGYLPGMYIIAAIPFLALAVAVVMDSASRLLAKIVVSAHLPEAAAGALVVLILALVIVPPWSVMNQRLMAGNENANWEKALQWSKANLPKDDVALVPYSMWHDLNADGRHDPWKVIALEKMDLDSDFARRHPDGWRSIDWIIEGPPTSRNITNLGLENAGRVLEKSTVVAEFGEWKVRQVLSGGSPAAGEQQ